MGSVDRSDALRDMLRDAFMAGFKASGEGYNGEYPFDGDEHAIIRELSEAFEEWFRTHPPHKGESDG